MQRGKKLGLVTYEWRSRSFDLEKARVTRQKRFSQKEHGANRSEKVKE